MSLLRSLIVLLIANFCFVNLSSSFSTVETDGKLEVVRENKNSEHLKDPVTDLKRLSSITANNEKRISEEVLDEGASAHLGTILSGIVDEGSRESSKASPIYDASPDEYLIESLAHGKRRFDSDNVAALASTGRSTNNLRFMEQKQRDDLMALNQAASRAYSRRQMMMQNSYNNANLLGRGRKNWPNQFETQNLNRRSMSNVNNGAKQQQRQRHGKQTSADPKSARSLDNEMLMRANFRQQESRKRASKQLVSGKSSEEVDDDDIFKDDERENQSSANNDDDFASSDRRSDDDAESKDDDADEEEDDESGSSRGSSSGKRAGSGTKRNGRARGRKLKAASESHHDRDEVDERDSSAANDDGEEDSDSSNDIRRVAGSPIENSIQSTTSRALQRPLAAGLMLANNNHDNNNNNNNNLNHDSAPGDDSDQSATQLKHSSVELQAAAGSHHGHHGHYYQHVEVPKKKAWKFGFKRGNHKHEIERHEKGHKHKFHSSFKWHAKEKCKKKKKCKSVGKMTWEYKHAKKHHHG